MNLQTIKSISGKIEYVLLPFDTFKVLRPEIIKQLAQGNLEQHYEIFEPADYIDNPIALSRIQAGLTQEELAKLMSVSQAYISKIERQHAVTPKLLQKVKLVLESKISN